MNLRRYIQAGATFAWPLNGGQPLQEARDRHVVTGAPGVVNSPYGRALSFDGAADYITLGAAWEDQLRFDAGTQDFSVVMWLRRLRDTQLEVIFDKREANDDGWLFYFDGLDRLSFALDTRDAFSTGTIADTLWHNVIATIDRDGNVQLYIDGIPDGSVAAAGEVMATTTVPRIGANSFGAAANYFNGDIAGIVIIPRVLSAAECLCIGNGGAAIDVTAGLVGHWKLDDAAGLVAIDSSGSGYHGDLKNMVGNEWTAGVIAGAIEFIDNNDYIRFYDVAELNAVSAFTAAVWMWPDAIDVSQFLWYKLVNGNNNFVLKTLATGEMQCAVENGGAGYGSFDYSTVIGAGAWHHVAVVYDGIGAANADRLKIYVDSVEVVLAFTGTIPATTADLSTANLIIGSGGTSSFDGKLDDARIYNRALPQTDIDTLFAWRGNGGGGAF